MNDTNNVQALDINALMLPWGMMDMVGAPSVGDAAGDVGMAPIDPLADALNGQPLDWAFLGQGIALDGAPPEAGLALVGLVSRFRRD